jgi:hypothetical protein
MLHILIDYNNNTLRCLIKVPIDNLFAYVTELVISLLLSYLRVFKELYRVASTCSKSHLYDVYTIAARWHYLLLTIDNSDA